MVKVNHFSIFDNSLNRILMKKYQDALNFIYQHIKFGIKSGLDNIRSLCELLGNPHQKLKVIHIAGTNGKGSTAYFIFKALNKAGYKVGLFTSPHLISMRERFQLNNSAISQEAFIKECALIQKALEKNPDVTATYFEILTAIAFHYFAQEQVDYLILETGLGGRLDSTNICQPIATVVTQIGLDHINILGNTKEQILMEKLGIVKANIPLICGIKETNLLEITERHCQNHNAELLIPGQRFLFKLKNRGDHYIDNANLSFLTIQRIIPSYTSEEFQRAVQNEVWPGRTQTLRFSSGATILLDGSHNTSSIEKLFSTITTDNKQHYEFLVSFIEDKDYSSCLEVIIKNTSLVSFTTSTHPKSVTIDNIPKHLHNIAHVENLKNFLLEKINTPTTQLVCLGSLFLIGDIIQILKAHHEDLSWFTQFEPEFNEVR